jgi:hypothetical protein
MDLLAWFRRPSRITDRRALADFIDEHAAFLVQKGIYEYSRARAGHYAKVLFAEAGFQQAVEEARWRAYPLGLAMVGELVESILPANGPRHERAEALTELVLGVFDRYPVPAALDQAQWSAARAELDTRLQQIGLHPPKRAMDIPEPFAESYFNLLPIHAKLRAAESPTIRNYLRVTLCNIHDELTNRVDADALAAMLTKQPA